MFSGQSKHQASLDSSAGEETAPPPGPTPSRKELQSHCKDLETGKSKCFRCCLQSISDTTEDLGPTPTVPPACPVGREARGVTGREEGPVGLHWGLLTPLQKFSQAVVRSFLIIFEEFHFETSKNAFKCILQSFPSPLEISTQVCISF